MSVNAVPNEVTRCVDNPKPNCHGCGEHCSRYQRPGNALAEQGYLAFNQDHGMSHPSLV